MLRTPLRITAAVGVLMAAVACSNASPPTAPDAEMVQPPADTSATGARTTTGQWVRTGYDVTGTVTVRVVDDIATLTFSSDFAIGRTPGPFVYLNTERDPNRGAPLRIGALQRNNGAQQYTVRIPRDVDYRYVIIWCDPFNVPMADARIAFP